MRKLLGAGVLAVLALTAPAAARAEDAVRFAPLKAEELSPPQKAWADLISALPRNANGKLDRSAIAAEVRAWSTANEQGQA